MKNTPMLLLLFLPVCGLSVGQNTAAKQHTMFVVDNVTMVAESHTKLFGRVDTSAGEHHSAPKVMTEFSKRCPSVSFTQNQSAAEFVLQTQAGGTTLSDGKTMNVLYVSPAKRLKGMVKDVCTYISAH